MKTSQKVLRRRLAVKGRAGQRSPRVSVWTARTLMLCVAGAMLCAPHLAAGTGPATSPVSSVPGVPSPSADSAVHVREGGVSRSQVVALGRDLWVEGRVLRDASVLRGDAFVDGEIDGDLVVLNGSILVRTGGRVGGDAIALGGRVVAEDGAAIGGRTLSYPGASGALLALLEVPQLGGRATLLSAKIGLLLAWWLAGVLLILAFAPMMRRGVDRVGEPLESFWTGLTFLLAAGLGLTFLSGVAPALITLPLLVLLTVVALVLKIVGTVCVVLAFGGFSTRLLGRDGTDDLSRFLVGLLVLGGIKLLPWVGALLWSALTLVGMGAVLRDWVRPSPRERALPLP